MGRSSTAAGTRQPRSLLGLGSESVVRSKFLLFGLCAGLVVVGQVLLPKTGSSLPHPSHGSGRAEALLQHAQSPLKAPLGEDEQGPDARTLSRKQDTSHLPRRAEQDLRFPNQPWPKPLSPAETAFWVDVLGNYTDTVSQRPRQKAARGEPQKPVNVKTWVEQGHCKHADMYLALILDRLRPWSQGGISQRMIEEAVRLGKERSDLGSLLYQILDGDVFAKAEGNNLDIDVYARLFLDVLQVLKLPNMEFGVFSGRDLPVMLRHEVHPIFAYASADAFSEMLVPCPWYILPVVKKVGERPEGWKPLDLEGFRAREGKVYWRGSPNDFVYDADNVHFAPRIKLVDESLRHPDLIDAHLSSSLSLLATLPAEDECKLYRRWKVPTPPGVPAKEGCTDENVEKYRKQHEAQQTSDNNVTESSIRYGLNLDGTGHSERYASQLLNDQLIFKVDTPFFNFYSRFFLPYEHYIPVKYDLSDLSEKVAWANDNVKEAHRIMTQGARLAHSLFHPDEVFCYTGLALAAFGRLLGYEVSSVPREGADQFEAED